MIPELEPVYTNLHRLLEKLDAARAEIDGVLDTLERLSALAENTQKRLKEVRDDKGE